MQGLSDKILDHIGLCDLLVFTRPLPPPEVIVLLVLL